MVVGICRLSLMLPGSQSLKEKRSVLRRVKDAVRGKFHLSIAEVGDNDLWQTALLGYAVVANDRRFVESILDKVAQYVDSIAKVADEEREILNYGEEPISSAEMRHWEPNEAPPPVAQSAAPKRGKAIRAPKLPAEPFPWEKGEDD